MKSLGLLFAGLMLAGLFSTVGTARGSDFSIGLLTGYNNGLGFQLNGNVSGFAEDFPFAARFGLGYTAVGPGDAPLARKIFVNDATNGVPEKKGWFWDFHLDLLYRLFRHTSLSAGVSYSLFSGDFVFVGGNEDFEVTSKSWGLGIGLESRFRMSPKIDLVISPGVDYYIPSSLSGHDRAYGPGGENVNPRKNYGYADADRAIHQPKWVLRLMAGLSYSFGK